MSILKFSNGKCSSWLMHMWGDGIREDFFGAMAHKISHACAVLFWRVGNTRLGARDLSWSLGFVMGWLTLSLGQVTSFLWTSGSSSIPGWGWSGWGNFQLQHSRFLCLLNISYVLTHWPTPPFLVGSRSKFFNCCSRPSSFWLHPPLSASSFKLTYSSSDVSAFLLPIQIQFTCKASPKYYLPTEPSLTTFSGKDLYPSIADSHCCVFGPTCLL